MLTDPSLKTKLCFTTYSSQAKLQALEFLSWVAKSLWWHYTPGMIIFLLKDVSYTDTHVHTDTQLKWELGKSGNCLSHLFNSTICRVHTTWWVHTPCRTNRHRDEILILIHSFFLFLSRGTGRLLHAHSIISAFPSSSLIYSLAIFLGKTTGVFPQQEPMRKVS